MPSSPPSLPTWLRAVDDQIYIRTAYLALHKREKARTVASQSDRTSSPSFTQRLLGSRTAADPRAVRYSVSEGKRAENADSNRYMDILPYDRTRVLIPLSTHHDAHRYLNASWVRERSGGKWWIAGQAPLTHTAHAFLSLLDQALPPEGPDAASYPLQNPTRIRTVVQLTRNVESGITKAHSYFPLQVGRFIEVHPEDASSGELSLKVELVETETLEEENCLMSLVRVTSESPSEDVAPTGPVRTFLFRHLLFTSWPDHGVPKPEDRGSLLKFIEFVERINKTPVESDADAIAASDPPVFIHCSAGVGRTGTFIAISSLLRFYGLLDGSRRDTEGGPTAVAPLSQSLLGPLPRELQDDLIVQEVDSLREQRPVMVQRLEQLVLIYEVLTDAFTAPDLGGP